MTATPPNWQWCQGLTEEERKKYHDKINSKSRTIQRATKKGFADIVNLVDNIPTPTSDYAVCVIPANNSAMELLNISRESIKTYAKKCDADYIELTGDQHPDWPMANKYRLYQVTSKYNKTLYLDCDVFISPNADNIFDETPDDKISAYDEYEVWQLKNETGWIEQQQDTIIRRLNEKELHDKYLDNGRTIFPNSMINGGVLVIPKSCSHYYQQPESPYPKHWCFDQNYLTLLLPDDKFHKLDYKYNNLRESPWFYKNFHKSFFNHCNGGKGLIDKRKTELLKMSEAKSDTKRVSFLADRFKIGGVETWHQYLSKAIKPTIISSFNDSNPNWKIDWSEYCFDSGEEHCIKAINESDIAVVWLMGEHLRHILPKCDNMFSKKLISVMHNTINWEYYQASITPSIKTVCVGKDVKNGYIEYLEKNNYSFEEEDIICIENGPDSERIKPSVSRKQARNNLNIKEDDILLMSCCRINPQKNVDKMIEAMESLPANYKLLLVGIDSDIIMKDSYNKFDKISDYLDFEKERMGYPDGAYVLYERFYLLEMLQKACQSGRVQILPFCENIGNLMIAADIYLQPSRWEGFGLSATEAMLLKVPVIGTDVGILKSINTFKVPQKIETDRVHKCDSAEIDASDLADTIQNALSDQEKLKQTVEECYNHAKELETSFIEQWQKLIRDL